MPAGSPPSDAGTKPLPGTGAYYFASYNPNKQLVMKRNPYFKQWSRRRSPTAIRTDHAVVRPHGRGADHRDRERPGGLDARVTARRPAGRARHEVRESGARQHADGVLVRADEHESGAVQQREGAAGGELRDRPQRCRQDLRRSEARGAVVPGAPAGLPGLQAVLPVHEEPGHDVVGARPRQGEGARQGSRVPPGRRWRCSRPTTR